MADFTYLSLGAGVQSSALLVMSNECLYGCPQADVAIFADTQSEPAWVYEQLERLRDWSKIPVEVVTAGNLGQDTIDRHNGKRRRVANLPVFTLGADGRAAPLRRHCTREYKVEPIEKRVRQLLGYEPRQRIKEKVEALIGISVEEASRAKPSRTRWIANRHPLLDNRLSRLDCARILQPVGLPMPKKSACVFCPYRDNRTWRQIRDHHPQEWRRAVEFDKAVRDMSRSGVRSPVFVHRSLKPLDEAPIDTEQTELFIEECEGMCGV